MRRGAPILLAVRQISFRTSSSALVAQGHHVERVGAQGGVGTAFTNHGRDPFGSVGRNQLDQVRPLFTEQVEEASRVALSRPTAAHTSRPLSWSTTTVKYLWPRR